MKYIIILGDGMADEPIEMLGNKTPLQAAHTPTLDYIASKSRLGTLKTVPDGYPPGSEIAHLSLLGYDVAKVFEGRGSLEAASMGVNIEPGEMAMRCNIINITDGVIKNHSAGHISTEEATELIDFLQENLGNDYISFHAGVSYRHLLKIKNGNKNIVCTPPHDVPGTQFRDVLVKASSDEAIDTAEIINNLILKSQELLSQHPINKEREKQGKDPANSIWPWSPGYKPEMTTITENFGLKKGAVISAVDLIRGIGIYSGLTPIIVPGATGLADTNYEGKAEAAINALKEYDFVFLHVEASDEAGHEGNPDLKVKTIEYLDSRICRPIIEAIEKSGEDFTLAVLPDHPTPCNIRTHSAESVPVMIYSNTHNPDGICQYDEFSAKEGTLGAMIKDDFINNFFDLKTF